MTEKTKYTQEDMERIFKERVDYSWLEHPLKKGTIAEWTFLYPNGNRTAQVEYSYPMDENNSDDVIGRQVVLTNIKNKLWAICGQYTLAVGKKL